MREITPDTKINIYQLKTLLIYWVLENGLVIDTREEGSISPDGTKKKVGKEWEYIPAEKQETSKTDAEGRNFVTTPSGSLIFGEITKEIAEKMGTIQAPIKLSEGNYEYGKKHIKDKHWYELMSRYDSVEEFVEDIAKNYTEIYKGNIERETFILARKTQKGLLYIELKYTGEQPYYSVNSGGWYKTSKKNKKVWSHSTRTNQR